MRDERKLRALLANQITDPDEVICWVYFGNQYPLEWLSPAALKKYRRLYAKLDAERIAALPQRYGDDYAN